MDVGASSYSSTIGIFLVCLAFHDIQSPETSQIRSSHYYTEMFNRMDFFSGDHRMKI